MIDPRLHDSAKDILANAPMDDEPKALAWDHFYNSSTPDDLARNLLSVTGMPADVAEQLIEAKRVSTQTPVSASITPVLAALDHISQMDRRTLEVAEQHPTLLNHLIAVVTKH